MINMSKGRVSFVQHDVDYTDLYCRSWVRYSIMHSSDIRCVCLAKASADWLLTSVCISMCDEDLELDEDDAWHHS